MTEYQKIAIGLLGLTHPEMFLLGRRRAMLTAARAEPDHPAVPTGCAAPPSFKERVRQVVRVLQFALAALGLGSRVVGLADNSEVIKDLSATAKRLHGTG